MESVKESLAQNNKKPKTGDIVFFVIVGILIVIFILSFVLNTFVYYTYVVKGSSMENTLFTGDVLVANRYKTAKKGDIVILESDDGYIVKRIIATEGDTVKIEGGKVYVNDMDNPIKESYIKEQITYSNVSTRSTELRTWEVGKDEIFFLGDNRSVSSDSRSEKGLYTTDKITGVVGSWALKTKDIREFLMKIIPVKNTLNNKG